MKGVYTHNKKEKSPNWKGGITCVIKTCPTCSIVFSGTQKRVYCSRVCAYANPDRTRKMVEGRLKAGSYTNTYEDKVVSRKYPEYQASAKRRSITFDLQKDHFKSLIYGDCHYCGAECALGIDRIDSSVGYTIGNSVSCCSKCNFAKHTMSVGEFREHITLLYFNFVKK